METSEIRKRFVILLILAAITISSLIFLSIVQEPTIEYVTRFFKIVNQDEMKSTQMSELAGELLGNFFSIARIILWFILVISVIRFFNFLIFSRALRKTNSYELTTLIRNVVVILIYIIAFFIIFQSQYPKVQLAPLFTGSTIIGIVVGLALQDTLGNLFSGLALQADQPFQIGDVISIPNKGTGVIESITWRGVKIRTFQNKLLVIGNSILGKETVEVAPKNNLNARLVFFNTLYSDSPTKTIQVIREAVRQVENVSTKIRPIVRIRNLGDNGIDWEIKYWLDDYSKYNTTDALVRQRIWYAFRRENINFAYPTRTLYMEKSEPEETVVESENTIYERIKNVDIFAPLSEEETEKLTDAAHLRVFAPDEAIVQKDQPGGSMFVIHKGSVVIETVDEQGEKQIVGTLREGDFFGEMGLLTGEPRSATVVAKEETQVLQIGKFCLKPILDNNPGLIKTLSRIIEERRELLIQTEHQDIEKVTDQNKTVFKSIRKFFGLN
ncbi:mechanosensitive ion channel family protein [soil metagenome]